VDVVPDVAQVAQITDRVEPHRRAVLDQQGQQVTAPVQALMGQPQQRRAPRGIPQLPTVDQIHAGVGRQAAAGARHRLRLRLRLRKELAQPLQVGLLLEAGDPPVGPGDQHPVLSRDFVRAARHRGHRHQRLVRHVGGEHLRQREVEERVDG
jgi:hypothetical protein